jgi:hypothetical protein
MCKGGTSTSQTQTSSAPPANVQAAGSQLINQAQNIASQPYQPYQGAMVAGFTPQQQQGMNEVNQAQGTAQPYINSGAQMVAQGTAPIQIPQFSGQAVNSYYSPFQSDVIHSTEAQMQNMNQQQQQQVQGNAISAGAFGGDREAVAQGELANQQALANGQVLAGLENQGYNTALGEFNTQAQLGVGAQTTQNWLAENAGSVMANLGPLAQGSALSGAAGEMSAGGLQQQLAQEQLNIPYEQQIAQQAYPFQTSQYLANIEQGIGSTLGGTSNANLRQPDMSGAQTAGDAIALASIAAMAFANQGGRINAANGGRAHLASGGLPTVPDPSVTIIPGAPPSSAGRSTIPQPLMPSIDSGGSTPQIPWGAMGRRGSSGSGSSLSAANQDPYTAFTGGGMGPYPQSQNTYNTPISAGGADAASLDIASSGDWAHGGRIGYATGGAGGAVGSGRVAPTAPTIAADTPGGTAGAIGSNVPAVSLPGITYGSSTPGTSGSFPPPSPGGIVQNFGFSPGRGIPVPQGTGMSGVPTQNGNVPITPNFQWAPPPVSQSGGPGNFSAFPTMPTSGGQTPFTPPPSQSIANPDFRSPAPPPPSPTLAADVAALLQQQQLGAQIGPFAPNVGGTAARGGRIGYQGGGDIASAGASLAGNPVAGGQPMAANYMNRLSQMSPEQLQQLSVMYGGQNPLIQRALMMQRMSPPQASMQAGTPPGGAPAPQAAPGPQVAPGPQTMPGPQVTPQQQATGGRSGYDLGGEILHANASNQAPSMTARPVPPPGPGMMTGPQIGGPTPGMGQPNMPVPGQMQMQSPMLRAWGGRAGYDDGGDVPTFDFSGAFGAAANQLKGYFSPSEGKGMTAPYESDFKETPPHDLSHRFAPHSTPSWATPSATTPSAPASRFNPANQVQAGPPPIGQAGPMPNPAAVGQQGRQPDQPSGGPYKDDPKVYAPEGNPAGKLPAQSGPPRPVTTDKGPPAPVPPPGNSPQQIPSAAATGSQMRQPDAQPKPEQAKPAAASDGPKSAYPARSPWELMIALGAGMGASKAHHWQQAVGEGLLSAEGALRAGREDELKQFNSEKQASQFAEHLKLSRDQLDQMSKYRADMLQERQDIAHQQSLDREQNYAWMHDDRRARIDEQRAAQGDADAARRLNTRIHQETPIYFDKEGQPVFPGGNKGVYPPLGSTKSGTETQTKDIQGEIDKRAKDLGLDQAADMQERQQILDAAERDVYTRRGQPVPGRLGSPPLQAPPPVAERKKDQVYPTPKGPMKWTGEGWEPAQ